MEFVKTKKEESAFVATIDNPPVNALNFKLLEELVSAVKAGEADQEVRGIVITGAGNNAFCAGADLKIMQGLKPEDAERITRLGQNTFNYIENCSKPVIAALNGLTLGGGGELAMACDLRFASDRARFGQPEVTLGLIPAWGGTQRMSRLIGKAKAKELIFSGQIINAQEALKIGLVNKVVPDGEELRAAVDYVRLLAAKTAPFAVSQAKKAINEGLKQASIEKGLEIEVEAVRAVSQSEDLKEGIEAFLTKRQPKYTGR
ncbi:MAG: enoyl-CoA hydratase/isomerase family protein [Nitrososphaerales archaeon]